MTGRTRAGLRRRGATRVPTGEGAGEDEGRELDDGGGDGDGVTFALPKTDGVIVGATTAGEFCGLKPGASACEQPAITASASTPSNHFILTTNTG